MQSRTTRSRSANVATSRNCQPSWNMLYSFGKKQWTLLAVVSFYTLVTKNSDSMSRECRDDRCNVNQVDLLLASRCFINMCPETFFLSRHVWQLSERHSKKLKEDTNAHAHQCAKISQYSEGRKKNKKKNRWHKWHIPEVISEYFSGTLLTFSRRRFKQLPQAVYHKWLAHTRRNTAGQETIQDK